MTHAQSLRSIGMLWLGLSVGAAAQPAAATEYVVDQDHRSVGFEIGHLGDGTVAGSFREVSGQFTFDEKDVTKTKLTAEAKTASIFTDNDKRDDHLRKPDFFDAAKYPKITFVSKSATKTGDKTFKLLGDFNMHGVTKPVTFDVTWKDKVMAFGKEHRSFEGTAKINRKDFGINFSVLDGLLPLVGDDVTIKIKVDGIAK